MLLVLQRNLVTKQVHHELHKSKQALRLFRFYDICVRLVLFCVVAGDIPSIIEDINKTTVFMLESLDLVKVEIPIYAVTFKMVKIDVSKQYLFAES